MRWSDLLRMSMSSLRRRKLRTFLTVLGVVIGTASIVVMISLGLGLQQSMYKEVEENGGTTSMVVTSSEYGYDGGNSSEKESSVKYITDETIKELAGLEHVKSASPTIEMPIIAMKGKYMGYLYVTAVSQECLSDMKIDMVPGSRLPDPDSATLDLIVGNGVIEDFYERSSGRGYWETGEYADIDFMNDSLFLILDMDNYYQMESSMSGNSSMGEDGSSAPAKMPKKYSVKACGLVAGGPDNYNAHTYNTYCNVDQLKTLLQKEFRGRAIPGQPTTKSGKPYKQFVYSAAKLQADDMEEVENLAQTIRSMGYNVSTNMEWIKSMESQFAIIQGVLGGIGAVSLFVAAIGIANTMMMSIYERTKEIGVMKVIGCSLRNIREMFLLEAAFIGLLGGIVGNVLSFLMSVVINMFVPAEVSGGATLSYIPLWLVLLSMGFAMLVGMAAGFFPAMRAMKLSPLAAIRTE